MGRLIDQDKLIEYIYDTYGIGTGHVHSKSEFDIVCHIYEAPTVEAISTADYENRLKADMVTMLTEIQLEIEEKSKWEGDYSFAQGELFCRDLIQEKINILRG